MNECRRTAKHQHFMVNSRMAESVRFGFWQKFVLEDSYDCVRTAKHQHPMVKSNMAGFMKFGFGQ